MRTPLSGAGLLLLHWMLLVEVEVDFDVYRNGDWLTVFFRRLEFPGLHLLDDFLVKAHAQRPRELYVAHAAIGADDATDYDRALIFCLAGFFRVFRLGRVNLSRR